MVWFDGTLQDFEAAGLEDEKLCDSCSQFLPLDDFQQSEHYYGIYYSRRCRPCANARLRNLRREWWERNFRRDLIGNGQHVLSPERATQIIRKYQQHFGGIDGVAERLCKLIDDATDLTGDYNVAMRAFEMYWAMVQIANEEPVARYKLRNKPPTKRQQGNKLWELPF